MLSYANCNYTRCRFICLYCRTATPLFSFSQAQNLHFCAVTRRLMAQFDWELSSGELSRELFWLTWWNKGLLFVLKTRLFAQQKQTKIHKALLNTTFLLISSFQFWHIIQQRFASFAFRQAPRWRAQIFPYFDTSALMFCVVKVLNIHGPVNIHWSPSEVFLWSIFTCKLWAPPHTNHYQPESGYCCFRQAAATVGKNLPSKKHTHPKPGFESYFFLPIPTTYYVCSGGSYFYTKRRICCQLYLWIIFTREQIASKPKRPIERVVGDGIKRILHLPTCSFISPTLAAKVIYTKVAWKI